MAKIKAVQSIIRQETGDRVIVSLDEIQNFTGPLPQ